MLSLLASPITYTTTKQKRLEALEKARALGNFTTGFCTEVYKCKDGYEFKANAATIVGNTAAQCCDGPFCSEFNCPDQFAYVENYEKKECSATKCTKNECCHPMCSLFTGCGTAYELIQDAHSTEGDNVSTCCTGPMCAEFQCTANYELKATASEIIGSSNAKCCDAKCSEYTCAQKGYRLKKDSHTLFGESDADCCDGPWCSESFECESGERYSTSRASETKCAKDPCTDSECCDDGAKAKISTKKLGEKAPPTN